jgi:alkylation response protein AidB-like acyl-CoA dehydrogenase
MDLSLSRDQRALQEGLRDFLGGEWDADRLRAAADGMPLRPADWAALAELGVFGLTVAEDAGGMGLTLADAAIVFEELGAALVPGPLVPSVLTAGLVPGVAEGEAIVTLLDTSTPVSVVEHPGIATHVVVAGADGLFLLAAADLDAVPVETPVDPLTPVAAVRDAHALRGAGERIGTAADAADLLRRGTVLTAALQVGIARGGLDLAVRYAKERVQFDRVIGGFQAVKHLLAESLVRVDLARAAVLSAALTVADPEAGSAAEAVATAKLLADDAATAGGRTCVQVHGGMGFTWEVLAHLYLKRAWVHETAFGTADEHAVLLAEELAGRA